MLNLNSSKVSWFFLLISLTIFIWLLLSNAQNRVIESERDYETYMSWKIKYPTEHLAWERYVQSARQDKPPCTSSGTWIKDYSWYRHYRICNNWIASPPTKLSFWDSVVKQLDYITSKDDILIFLVLIFIVVPWIGSVVLLKIAQFAIIENRIQKWWFRLSISISLIILTLALLYGFLFSWEEIVWVWKSIILGIGSLVCSLSTRALYFWVKDGFSRDSDK